MVNVLPQDFSARVRFKASTPQLKVMQMDREGEGEEIIQKSDELKGSIQNSDLQLKVSELFINLF